ncbi:hypothetical protein F5050DRAFT_1665060 [Lentinula boryana]|uniref:Uncharacterized protein n=1 Tax=Lentinula boryana TaxID=40481 RepID=A0ABQ8QQX5_9AGAR|nr:hypothetical protein F5050DRAFT_1665060 [Lentinula boryana]
MNSPASARSSTEHALNSYTDLTEYHYVPSLVYLCIRQLASYPDQISAVALNYAPPRDSTKFDILKALIPSYHDDSFTISTVDPRLWATLVQIYGASLPEIFRTYPIALTDTRLPLVQCIPATSTFSLITILELPGCPQLTDETLTPVKLLYNLTAFDASETKISAWGLKKLMIPALSVEHTEDTDSLFKVGPLGLRILRLRNCKAIDHTIFTSLQKLLLLSVIDLRGTSCIPSSIPPPYNQWSSAGLEQSISSSLYHPTPLAQSMTSLRSINALHPSTTIFQLHVESIWRYPIEDNVMNAPVVEIEDQAVTFTPDAMLLHPSQPPDMDQYMDKVAEEEARELANRQKIRKFYASASKGRLYIPSARYSPRKYYAELALREKLRLSHDTVRSDFDDSNRPKKKRRLPNREPPIDPSPSLMLYRAPPPWRDIEHLLPAEIHPSKLNQSRPADFTKAAIVNKSRMRMQLIADFEVSVGTTARNRRAGGAMACFDGVHSIRDTSSKPRNKEVSETVRPMLQGRNPFRRSETVTTVSISTPAPKSCFVESTFIGSSKSNEGIKDTRVTSMTTAQPKQQSSTSPKRPLKPISSVRVPELPPEEMRKLKESMIKKPRASLPLGSSSLASDRSSDSLRRKSLPTGRDRDIEKLKRNSMDVPISHKRRLDEALEMPQLRVDEKSSRSRIQTNANAKRKIGFDWKTWGNS